MIVGIISDIHGNLPAFEAVAAKIRHVDRVICLGDVVNYGPWSNECLELLGTLPKVILLEGNHEALYLGKSNLAHEIPLVQQFYRATIERFKRYDLIRHLPLQVADLGYLFTHTFDGLKIYPDTAFIPPCDCFIGHSHFSFKDIRAGRQLVNPGSVGQNRRKLELASYALLDTDSGDVNLEQVTYSVKSLINEMYALSYPRECLEYYLSKT